MVAAALAVDIGMDYYSQRRLQQVAEAAALAAARHLPDSGTAGNCASIPTDPAGAAACDSVATNLTGSKLSNVKVTWTPNWGSRSDQVEVAVTADSPNLFGRVIGIFSTTITQRAAATNTATGASAAALYAASTSCATPGITIGGNGPVISGAVESNGSLTLSSNGQGTASVDGAVYGGPNNCPYTNSGKVSFVGPNEPVNGSPQQFPWPEAWTMPTCDHTVSGAYTLPNGASGIYCDPTGTITIGNNTTAAVTLIANGFSFGQHATLTPAADGPTAPDDPQLGLLLWYTGTTTFDVSPQNSSFTGSIYAPNAQITMSGNSAITGFIEAQGVTISGNSFTLTGTGPSLPGAFSSLAVIE